MTPSNRKLLWAIFLLQGFAAATFAAPLPGEHTQDSEYNRIRRRDVRAGGVTIKQSLHQAAALGALTLLVTAHRTVMDTGFRHSRSNISTDATISTLITVISTLWTALVLISGFLIGNPPPCSIGITECLARAAYAPWLMQTMAIFWLFGLVDLHSKTKGCWLWELRCSRGPFDWKACVNPWFRRFMVVVMLAFVGITSSGAMMIQLYTIGILNIVGVALFAIGASGTNNYILSPQKYEDDMIRIALPTSHYEGTVYILPSDGYGFDAAWSPKIASEHTQADQEMMSLFQSIRSNEWTRNEPLQRVRATLASFLPKVSISKSGLDNLARWIYCQPGCPPSMRSIRCLRAKDTHLIGRDLMFALCHAEYLVYMNRDRLESGLCKHTAMLRNSERGGGGDSSHRRAIGFQGGLEGFREAIKWVYAVFGESLDDLALNPVATTFPSSSKIFADNALPPSSIDEYTRQLWDFAINNGESTVSALYIFTCIWHIEVGNGRGFHIFPLRVNDKKGDTVAWHCIWRQGWYTCIIAQLVTMSPIVLSAFISGIFR